MASKAVSCYTIPIPVDFKNSQTLFRLPRKDGGTVQKLVGTKEIAAWANSRSYLNFVKDAAAAKKLSSSNRMICNGREFAKYLARFTDLDSRIVKLGAKGLMGDFQAYLTEEPCPDECDQKDEYDPMDEWSTTPRGDADCEYTKGCCGTRGCRKCPKCPGPFRGPYASSSLYPAGRGGLANLVQRPVELIRKTDTKQECPFPEVQKALNNMVVTQNIKLVNDLYKIHLAEYKQRTKGTSCVGTVVALSTCVPCEDECEDECDGDVCEPAACREMDVIDLSTSAQRAADEKRAVKLKGGGTVTPRAKRKGRK